MVERVLYKELIRDSQTFSDLMIMIEAYRRANLEGIRPREPIPG